MSINTGASIFIAGCRLKEILHHGIECIVGVVCNLNLKKCLIMVKIFHLYILSCEGCMELPGLRPPTSVGRAPDASRQTETAYPDGIRASKAAGVAGALQEADCAASGRAEAEDAFMSIGITRKTLFLFVSAGNLAAASMFWWCFKPDEKPRDCCTRGLLWFRKARRTRLAERVERNVAHMGWMEFFLKVIRRLVLIECCRVVWR